MASNAQITHISTQRFNFDENFVTPRSKVREERRLARQVVLIHAPKKAVATLPGGRGRFQSPLMFLHSRAATEIQRMWRGCVNRSDDADMAEILDWLRRSGATVGIVKCFGD